VRGLAAVVEVDMVEVDEDGGGRALCQVVHCASSCGHVREECGGGFAVGPDFRLPFYN
jgi:hypothetical protein